MSSPDRDTDTGMPSDAPALRLLVLMRHGHAKDSGPQGDRSRELSKRGRAEATAVGEWLRAQGVRPDVVVVSPARRTVQTWEAIDAAGLHCPDVWSDEAIYDAYPGEIVESIHAVPDDARTLFVIGHAPGIPGLAGDLNGRDDLDPAMRAVLDRWPTAGCAVVSHDGPWSDFPSDGSTVAVAHAP